MSGRRRIVAGLALAALAAPAARAQQAKPARVVVLARSPIPEIQAFRERMREFGWVESRTWVLEERHAGGGNMEKLRETAAAVMRSAPDVVWAGHSEAALAAKRASSTIPIVFNAIDPVGGSLVASLARPGGNATGLYVSDADFIGKQIEILHDAFLAVGRIAVLHADAPTMHRIMDGAKAAASLIKVEILPIVVTDAAALGQELEAIPRGGAARGRSS